MKDSVEFKELIEKIIDSYESKVKMVTSLMRQVHQKIIKYQNDQDLMINKLRDILGGSWKGYLW
jgi:DNA polymerase III delta subunit